MRESNGRDGNERTIVPLFTGMNDDDLGVQGGARIVPIREAGRGLLTPESARAFREVLDWHGFHSNPEIEG